MPKTKINAAKGYPIGLSEPCQDNTGFGLEFPAPGAVNLILKGLYRAAWGRRNSTTLDLTNCLARRAWERATFFLGLWVRFRLYFGKLANERRSHPCPCPMQQAPRGPPRGPRQPEGFWAPKGKPRDETPTLLSNKLFPGIILKMLSDLIE